METRKLKSFSRDPFAVDPLPKAHYYPSPEKQLSARQKATALSFTCEEEDAWDSDQADSPVDRPVKISALDELFLKGTNYFSSKPHDRPATTDDDHQLDESWPDSERPSSISLTGVEDDSQLDLENYHSIIDRFTKPKSGDRGQTTIPTSQPRQGTKSESAPGSVATIKGPVVAGERLRMPGTSTQTSGATGQTGKSRLPVKQSRPSVTKPSTRGRGSSNKKENVPPKQQEDEGSVLQKYIDRFRNSAPMSREERQQKSDDNRKEFWWLKESADGVAPSPGDSFTQVVDPGPTEHLRPDHVTSGWQGEEDRVKYGRSQLTVANMEKYRRLHESENSRYNVAESPGDKRTLELQRRAEQLLERSLSSVASTEPAVSTEGLGSNMSDVSALEDYSYRPKFAPYLESDVPRRSGLPPPLPGQRPPPDDDPLQQWRLRRKMETAQQGQSSLAYQDFNFLSKTEQQKKIDSKLEEFKQRLAGKGASTARVSSSNVQFTPAPAQHHLGPLHIQTQDDADGVQPQIASPSLKPCRPRTDPKAEVDPHLHLMCDLLPCPHRGEYRESTGNSTKQGSRLESKGGDSNVNSKNSSKGSDSNAHSQYSPTGDNFCDKNSKIDGTEEQRCKRLQAEKPDVESQRSYSDISENMETEHSRLDKHGDLEKMVQDIMVNKDKYIDPRDSVDQSFNVASKSGKSRQNEDSDRKNSKSKENSDRNRKCAKSEGIESNDKHERPKEKERERHREDRSCNAPKEKVIKPKHSSSPTLERKGVDAAIGQVIKEHLFSTSMSTVLSSVESLPPAPSHERHLPATRKPALPAHHEATTHTDDDMDSDGEFPSDDLLVMLRRQRAAYERQIQQIDKLLEDVES